MDGIDVKWAIDFPIPKPSFEITTTDGIFWLGSCFAQSIGAKFQNLGWKGLINPFGVMYNPISMANILNVMTSSNLSREAFFCHQELWRHWDVHSDFAQTSLQKSLETLQRQQQIAAQHWQTSSVLVLTLGSAYGWRHLQQDKIVANCHQISSKQFARELLAMSDMKQALLSLIDAFAEGKNHPKIVLTVSPIRYLRDGLMDSNRSKARLLEIAHQIQDEYDNVILFPAYEILIDQLRDYRFYTEDMVHPSAEAVHEIWNIFVKSFVSKSGQQAITEGLELQRMCQHKLRFPDSASAKQFLQIREQRIIQWQQQYQLGQIK